MIKHHNFFKTHLPIKDYKAESKDDLIEIILEEFHLVFDGKMTKDYESKSPKQDKYEISLYPSILYAANKLYYSENEKFQMVNDFLDRAFVDFLERFNPLYKCTSFIEYHLYYFQGNKEDFYKHIKYQILSIIKSRKETNNLNFDYESLQTIVLDWVDSKMKKENKFETNIKNAKNVIVNNNSKVKNQLYSNKKISKNRIAMYSFLIAVVGIIITIIIGWENIKNFFNFLF